MLDELKKTLCKEWKVLKLIGTFRIQSKIYDGAFLQKQLKPSNDFYEKAAPCMFDWVLITPLKRSKFSRRT